MSHQRRLVLGSTSRYRAGLLGRLGLPFEQRAPGTSETELPGEAPAARAMRLAIAKATDAGNGLTDALVIGSDQVAELGGLLLEKPGSVERAHAQLGSCSGHIVSFHTALCVLDTANARISISRACIFACCHLKKSAVTSSASSHWIAPEVSNAKDSASACSSALRTTIQPH
jgi:predicted house-cleaning NTP pyrophosphatase (Maf/HAM1 superfamily)